MKKQELIDEILPLLKLGTHQERSKMRAELESHTLTELQAYLSIVRDPGYQLEADETALDEMKAARNREFALMQIFKFSGLKNTTKNETLLDQLLGPALSLETFRSLIEKNLQYQNRFEWNSAPFGRIKAAEADQSKQRTKVRQAFSAAAKAVTAQGVNDVSACDANFKLVCGVLGTDFTVAQALKALTNGSIQALASSGNADELRAAYQQKQIDDHNQSLMNADTKTLREITRQEIADQRQNSAQEQADRELQHGLQRVSQMGYPLLPGVWRGEKLDANYIRKCSIETHKILTARFGSGQLTARLRGN